MSAGDRQSRLTHRIEIVGILVTVAGLVWAVFTFFTPDDPVVEPKVPPPSTSAPDGVPATRSSTSPTDAGAGPGAGATTTNRPYPGPGRGEVPTATSRTDAGTGTGRDTTSPDTSTTDPPPLRTDDFTVGHYRDIQCSLRSGDNGYWDVDMWFTIGWTSTNGAQLPPNKLRLTTDVGRSQDWLFGVAPTPPGHSALNQPGNVLNAFVDQDDRYLGRLLRVTATVDSDDAVAETSELNNTIALIVDLRTALPPPNTNQPVDCYQE